MLYYKHDGPGFNFDHIASLGALLLWMKFISMVRALNKRIATFVLMLNTIFLDLKSFLFVLTSVMVMFGHSLFLILGQQQLNYDEGGDEEEDQNFATIWYTARTLWSIVLGNYETSDFPDLYTNIVAIVYTMIVVVVMLNVLIAIVGDSYDNAMSRSDELFWRARLELVAEISVTFRPLLLTEEKWEEFINRRGNRVERMREHIVAAKGSPLKCLLVLVLSPLLLLLFFVGELYVLFVVGPAQMMVRKRRRKRAKKLKN